MGMIDVGQLNFKGCTYNKVLGCREAYSHAAYEKKKRVACSLPVGARDQDESLTRAHSPWWQAHNFRMRPCTVQFTV